MSIIDTKDLSRGAVDVLTERDRQLFVEGFDDGHDDNHDERALPMARPRAMPWRPAVSHGRASQPTFGPSLSSGGSRAAPAKTWCAPPPC